MKKLMTIMAVLFCLLGCKQQKDKNALMDTVINHGWPPASIVTGGDLDTSIFYVPNGEKNHIIDSLINHIKILECIMRESYDEHLRITELTETMKIAIDRYENYYHNLYGPPDSIAMNKLIKLLNPNK